MTKIIGLTGGMGSGKTTMAKLMQAKGIPVYIADDQAKIIMTHPSTIQAITTVFGNTILSNQLIDKKKLAALVFNNPSALQKLNKIIHPLVKKDFDIWVQKYTNAPFVVKESAILFESGSYLSCHAIITVVAPLSIRIDRIKQRESITEKQIMLRINNQWSDTQRIKNSDFVIQNTHFTVAKQQLNLITEQLKN